MTLNDRTAPLYCTNDILAAKRTPGILLSGSLRLMRIFLGISWRKDVKRKAWPEPAIISNFGRYIYGTFRVEASINICRCEVVYRLSSNPKMLDLEWP